MNLSALEPDLAVYVAGAAKLLGVDLAAEHLPGVVASLEQLQAIAVSLRAFPIAEHEEIAPVFVP